MLKWGHLFLGGILLFPKAGWAEVALNQEGTAKSGAHQSVGKLSNVEIKPSTYGIQRVADQEGTKIIDIPTDQEPPPSAEIVAPTHPFFAAPNSANELMDKIETLENRIKELEKNSPVRENGNIKIQSSGGVWIESIGQDIVIHTPGSVKLEAKNVVMPSTNQQQHSTGTFNPVTEKSE
ncbi:MAG: hypothetical protein K2P93_07900 [Alphaproteobacteria bacterium]|nr:hypothetical protein [Alphaproteobacteria bacterium]